MKHDLSLVKKAQRGNPRAFGELVRQQQESLYRMAYSVTRNEDDALDAVQEGILRAYKSLKSLREPKFFATWLTRITVNAARDLVKQRRPAEDVDELELPAPEGLSPEERMDLQAAVEHLPEAERELVQLRYFDGLTNREIARQMDLPEGTVASRLHRALGRMRVELKEEKNVGVS